MIENVPDFIGHDRPTYALGVEYHANRDDGLWIAIFYIEQSLAVSWQECAQINESLDAVRHLFAGDRDGNASERVANQNYLAGQILDTANQMPTICIYAMYLLLTACKGHSQLATIERDRHRKVPLGSMLDRIREACGPDLTTLAASSKSMKPLSAAKRPTSMSIKSSSQGAARLAKRQFSGCARKGGRTLAKTITNTDAGTVQVEIHRHVETGSTLHTDEAGAYAGIGDMFFEHNTVKHKEGEFSRDGVTTNGIESVFAVLKRGMIGVYHHASKKHLNRYVDEFAFRLNEGNVKHHTLTRLESLVGAVAGKRLTYADLIA